VIVAYLKIMTQKGSSTTIHFLVLMRGQNVHLFSPFRFYNIKKLSPLCQILQESNLALVAHFK
jgi:hypothetical protein